MQHHPRRGDTPYPVYSTSIDHFEDLALLSWPSDNFVLFLAADFSTISSEDLVPLAMKLIGQGLAYVCVWGPECERAHDDFDLAEVMMEIEQGFDKLVISTWHDDEPLEDALWFALNTAFTSDGDWGETSIVCVSVASPEWSRRLGALLHDVDTFSKSWLDQDEEA